MFFISFEFVFIVFNILCFEKCDTVCVIFVLQNNQFVGYLQAQVVNLDWSL
jgi:hypothetical protein